MCCHNYFIQSLKSFRSLLSLAERVVSKLTDRSSVEFKFVCRGGCPLAGAAATVTGILVSTCVGLSRSMDISYSGVPIFTRNHFCPCSITSYGPVYGRCNGP